MRTTVQAWLPVPGLPRHAPGGRFLAGPIEWKWLVTAAACGAKALHVGIALWHLAFLTRSSEVKLTNKVLQELKVSRSQKSRALVEFERLGLVDVLRSKTRAPIVRLKNAPGRAVVRGEGAGTGPRARLAAESDRSLAEVGSKGVEA